MKNYIRTTLTELKNPVEIGWIDDFFCLFFLIKTTLENENDVLFQPFPVFFLGTYDYVCDMNVCRIRETSETQRNGRNRNPVGSPIKHIEMGIVLEKKRS